ncbi:hybrid sensor histidine kinase/response regulator [Poseidonibacter parvus]|uniref:histidine kinase n=1 Tax=Poseidonibacter parvus TaxID=1850254 RepID=A0A1P8KQY5_9BACT|nr:hybrid sensor histidine kinase/response regulator [Poseidonibacter parvus]
MKDFNILLVDDIEDNLYSLELLIKENFELNIFKSLSAEDAMNVIIENKIDLILCDVQMPDIDGFEFAQYLKEIENTKDIPIVFITGIYNKDEYKSKGYDLGAVDYITKPINDELFYSKLNVYIDIYNQKKQKDEKLEKTESLLVHNSKMASMGEIIGLISHQLKQPLNTLSLYCADVKLSHEYGEINDEYIKEHSENTKNQITYMNETIDSFLDFFNPNKIKSNYYISEAINKALELLKSKIHINDIKLNIDIDETIEILGTEMEFTQVVVNIVNNSIDAFIEKYPNNEDVNKIINISVKKESDIILITLEDNAGGISNNNIEEILDPYYTTKENGTGVGLYMVNLIVKNYMHGDLKISNSNIGLKFEIFLS